MINKICHTPVHREGNLHPVLRTLEVGLPRIQALEAGNEPVTETVKQLEASPLWSTPRIGYVVLGKSERRETVTVIVT